MRNATITALSVADTASANGPAIPSNQTISASFQIIFGDTAAAGTVKIQASNNQAPAGQLATFTPTNWVDIPSATVTVTAGGSFLITIVQSCYQWMRVVYTQTTTGSSTLVVLANTLSV